MNFLAHLYLSGDDTQLMVGNFIGDFVKGRHGADRFDPLIAKGIALHRAIDAFTDTHAVVTQSKNRLRPKYRHYSGVIVDVFYDYFLAKQWNDYHPDPLPVFAAHAYSTIESFGPILPKEVNDMLPYMIKWNWLVSYSELEGIHKALSGMSKRTPYESKMDEAVGELESYYQEFKNEFDIFFPELKKHCEEKVQQWP